MEEGDYIETPTTFSAVKMRWWKSCRYTEDEDFIEFLKCNFFTLQNIYKMSDCSVQCKKAGVIFTKGIQGEYGTLKREYWVRKLESTLKGTVLILYNIGQSKNYVDEFNLKKNG
jgi:hypothetical protein